MAQPALLPPRALRQTEKQLCCPCQSDLDAQGQPGELRVGDPQTCSRILAVPLIAFVILNNPLPLCLAPLWVLVRDYLPHPPVGTQGPGVFPRCLGSLTKV